jgi:hypothetical protein
VIVEPFEPLRPELLLLRKPRRRGGQRGRRETRAAPPAVLAPGDEPCVLEDLQVSRDRREADGERRRELGDRRLTSGQASHDAAARGIGKRAEEQVEVLAGSLGRDT